MFCAKCGKELNSDALFCPNCGTKVPSFSEESTSSSNEQIKSSTSQANSEDTGSTGTINNEKDDAVKNDNSDHNPQKTYAEPNDPKEAAPNQQNNSGEQKGIFNKIWNNEAFTNFAIKYDQLLDWVRIPLGIIVAIVLFREGGFWGILFGLIFLVYALSSVINIISRFIKRKEYFSKNRICPSCGAESASQGFCSRCGAQMPHLSAKELEDEEGLKPENIKAKKKRVLWTPVVVALAIILIMSGVLGGNMDPHVLAVKNGHPSSYPNKTYGEAFDDFFGSPKWKYFQGTKEGSDEDGDGKPNTEEENVDVVEFTGYCTYSGTEVKATLQFTLNDDDTFNVSYLSFNDVPQNMLTMAGLLSAVFEDDTSDSSSSVENDIVVPTVDADLASSESNDDSTDLEQAEIEDSKEISEGNSGNDLSPEICGTFVRNCEDGTKLIIEIKDVSGLGYMMDLCKMSNSNTLLDKEGGLKVTGKTDRCMGSGPSSNIIIKFIDSNTFDVISMSTGVFEGRFKRSDATGNVGSDDTNKVSSYDKQMQNNDYVAPGEYFTSDADRYEYTTDFVYVNSPNSNYANIRYDADVNSDVKYQWANGTILDYLGETIDTPDGRTWIYVGYYYWDDYEGDGMPRYVDGWISAAVCELYG